MAKVLRIDRKQMSTGRELVTVQRRATKTKPRITMTQEQAWRIFNRVATFHSPEETYENLILELANTASPHLLARTDWSQI